MWPVALIAGRFILLALPFGETSYNWAEPGMYGAFFLGFVLSGCLPRSDEQRRYSVVVLVGVAAVTAAFMVVPL